MRSDKNITYNSFCRAAFPKTTVCFVLLNIFCAFTVLTGSASTNYLFNFVQMSHSNNRIVN